MSAVGEPGYLPYCGRCTGLVRMVRGVDAFRCTRCKLETRNVNGEDMFDRTAPLPHKPITTMSDREKLDFIAASYNNLMAMERDRRALIAQMIRACTQRIRREAPRGDGGFAQAHADRKKWRDDIAAAWKGLDDLATMLEAESVRSPDTKSTEG